MPTLNKILYAEDELDIQEVVKIALEDLGGFKLKVCSSGEEALQELESFKPELILMDVMMPGMDGPTTMKAIKEKPEGKNIPVIFMTAKAQMVEIEELKNLGAIDVIVKPFEPMTLADQISVLWQKYQDNQ